MMSLFENGKLQFARLFGRPGESPPPRDDDAAVSDARRQEERQRRVTETRRALDLEVQKAERRRREELPALREAVTKAEAELARVRKEVQVAEAAFSHARCAESNLDYSLRMDIDRARIELTRTAWPWLFVAIEAAEERRSRFSTYERGQLQNWRSQRVSVAPHPSDPDFGLMCAHGATYKMNRVATNNAALDEVKAGLDKAVEALRRLPWRVEEPEEQEVEALLAAFDETTWRKAAEKFVWTEPSPPKYDAKGTRIDV